MRAKEAKDANDQKPDAGPPKICEGALRNGTKKPANKQNCYCAQDPDEKFATNSDKQCDEIAKRVKENDYQNGDAQEDQLSLRQCEIRKAQADDCCADSKKCLSNTDLTPVMSPPGEGISHACKTMRDRASENATANVNAGGACTQAYANCQAECESSAKKYPDGDQTPKIRQVAQSCKSLGQKAKQLGEQGVETLVSGYFGQNCEGLSQSADRDESGNKIPMPTPGPTPGNRAPPTTAPRDGGDGRYVNTTQGDDILQRNLAGPGGGGDDPYAREELSAPIMFTPTYDRPRPGPSLNALAAVMPGPQLGGAHSAPLGGGAARGSAPVGAAGFTPANAEPAVLNRIYIPGNRGALVPASAGGGKTAAGMPGAPVNGLAPASAGGRPGEAGGKIAAQSLAGKGVALANAAAPANGNTVKELNPLGKAASMGGPGGMAAMSATGGGTARDVAGSGSLKDYLPGGSHDPRTGIGGAARPSQEIHAKHVNLFEVINEVMSEKCQLGELYDCG